jgi:hypothetical protein
MNHTIDLLVKQPPFQSGIHLADAAHIARQARLGMLTAGKGWQMYLNRTKPSCGGQGGGNEVDLLTIARQGYDNQQE